MVSQVVIATIGSAIWIASIHVDYPARLALVSFSFGPLPLSVSSWHILIAHWLDLLYAGLSKSHWSLADEFALSRSGSRCLLVCLCSMIMGIWLRP